MRCLIVAGLLIVFAATSLAEDKPAPQAPVDDWSEEFSKKFAGVDLWDQEPETDEPSHEAPDGDLGAEFENKFADIDLDLRTKKPKKKETASKDTPQTVDEYDKDGSLANVPATDEQSSSSNVHGKLSEELVDLVWKKIDVNRNGSATDREASAAIKPVRIAINSKVSSPPRDSARESLEMSDDAILSRREAFTLVARVRGMKCPTAMRARQYFLDLDQDHNGSVNSAEVVKTLSKLGAVGHYLALQLAPTLRYLDSDDDHKIDLNEAQYSANVLLRVKLATEGENLAKRNPADWLQVVSVVSGLDVDADNVVSRAESRRAASLAVDFNRIDRNRDQRITTSELSDYQQYLQRVAIAAREAAYREQVNRMRSMMARAQRGNNVASNKGRNVASKGNKGCFT